MRPPGRKTRAASRKTAALSGTRLITQLLVIASIALSSTGSDSSRPFRNSIWFHPASAAEARARAIISSVMSTPMTRPDGPTARAARMASSPAPDPRSRTVSPGPRSRRPTGAPQPRPRFDACGAAVRSRSS